MRNRKLGVAVSVAATIALVVGIAIARAGSAGPDTAANAPQAVAKASGISPEIAAHFGIFRRSQAASDAPTASTRVLVDDTDYPNTAGANPSLARTARTIGAAGHRISVIAGNQAVCMTDEASAGGNGGGCAPLSIAEKGLFVKSSAGTLFGLTGDQRLVYGLVPDGISSVGVTDPDGSSRDVAVADNVFSTVVSSTGDYGLTIGDQQISAP